MPTKRGKTLQAKALRRRLQKKHRRFNRLLKTGKRSALNHTPPAPLPETRITTGS